TVSLRSMAAATSKGNMEVVSRPTWKRALKSFNIQQLGRSQHTACWKQEESDPAFMDVRNVHGPVGMRPSFGASSKIGGVSSNTWASCGEWEAARVHIQLSIGEARSSSNLESPSSKQVQQVCGQNTDNIQQQQHGSWSSSLDLSRCVWREWEVQQKETAGLPLLSSVD
ncbi:hypothetical protein VIGAN_09087400, partial [Vigna angularis var. angularis]